MDWTAFKTQAEAVQAVIISGAAALGGAWAVYRFWKLGELAQTRAALAKADIEIETLRRSLIQRPTVLLTLTATSVDEPGGDHYFIEARAVAENVGNRTEILDWSRGCLRTARVVRGVDGLAAYEGWRQTALADWEEVAATRIGPGAKVSFLFVVPVDVPGLYLACLDVDGSPEEVAMALAEVRSGGVDGGTGRWSAQALVRVPLTTRVETALTGGNRAE